LATWWRVWLQVAVLLGGLLAYRAFQRGSVGQTVLVDGLQPLGKSCLVTEAPAARPPQPRLAIRTGVGFLPGALPRPCRDRRGRMPAWAVPQRSGIRRKRLHLRVPAVRSDASSRVLLLPQWLLGDGVRGGAQGRCPAGLGVRRIGVRSRVTAGGRRDAGPVRSSAPEGPSRLRKGGKGYRGLRLQDRGSAGNLLLSRDPWPPASQPSRLRYCGGHQSEREPLVWRKSDLPRYNDLVTDMPADFVQAFKDAGFDWGGDWVAHPDPMPFEWAGWLSELVP